jgi:[protein-PII] uridylyltransferase
VHTTPSGVRGFAAERALRSAETDRWLARLLGVEPDTALVAVGGYGRRELTPGSDLDVVLVHRGRRDIAALADRIWYPIWDSGTRLDHAVRTVPEARAVARDDTKAALGMLHARHIAGDPVLTDELRAGVLTDWRTHARRRLGELVAMTADRADRFGELAFLLEPDLKEARGGLRDVHAVQAVAAAWVAPAPGPKVKAAYETILDARHALHEVSGRSADRLVLQEQDEVAVALGLLDADALLRALAGAARGVAYAFDQCARHVERFRTPRRRGRGRGTTQRRPLADGLVEHDGAVVLARGVEPGGDPTLTLRAAAAAAASGLPIAAATLDKLPGPESLPVPWPPAARDALLSLLGTGHAAVPVWEALDQAGVVVGLFPDWERVRNRPQRDPIHTFTVDRHLIETAAHAAALTRDVGRPDLLLLAALFHDIGKGWPGEHSHTGSVVARELAARIGLGEDDAATLARVVRHHLLLPRTAVRRDLDDPATISTVTKAVGDREVLDLLAALSIADGRATGPAAWNDWKAALVADLAGRARAALDGRTTPAPRLTDEQRELAEVGCPAVLVRGGQVTVVAHDRPGLLWRASGVLAAHRLTVRAATAAAHGTTAVTVYTVEPRYGSPPDATLLAEDLRRALEGRLDVAAKLKRGAERQRTAVPVPPPRVLEVPDASDTSTVIEVRAQDEPGLLWRIGRALSERGIDIRAARVETLGGAAVDTFYLVDRHGLPLDDDLCAAAVVSVRKALA